MSHGYSMDQHNFDSLQYAILTSVNLFIFTIFHNTVFVNCFKVLRVHKEQIPLG